MFCIGATLPFSSLLAAMPPYVHDPVIIESDGLYYLYASGTGIACYRSADLAEWERLGAVLEIQPSWLFETVPGYAGKAWAPDITYGDGLYRLYYSASTFGSNNSAIGLAVSPTLNPDDADYGWKDLGPVLISKDGEDDWNAIDPAAFEDADGGAWLAWGSFWSGIWTARIDPVTGKLSEGTEPVLLAARPDSPDNAVEAPFIFRRGKFYYLFVSWDYCCRGSFSDYKAVVGRSRHPDGPYRDHRGRRMTRGGGMPLLTGDERYPGKGHIAVFSSEGRERIVYHAYDSQRSGISVLQIDELEWDFWGWPHAVETLE